MNEVTKALVRLAAAFPRDRVPDSTIALYAGKLSMLDEALAVQAVESLVESARAFPTLAEIRQVYSGLRQRQIDATPKFDSAPGVPMPESVKSELQRVYERMDERAEELSS